MTNFWDLPRAVRKKIYPMHLVNNTTVTPVESGCPSLLVADPKIDREAARIYYGENIFEASDKKELKDWVQTVGQRGRNHIRKVKLASWPASLRLTASGNEQTFEKLKNLRKLELLILAIDEQHVIKELI